MSKNEELVVGSRRRATPFLLIGFAALGSRLLLFWLGNWEPGIIDDYDLIAHSLVQGHGFSFDGVLPTVCRAPVYPLYLAGIMAATGQVETPYTLLRFVDLFVDTLTAIFVFLLARGWLPKTGHHAHVAAGMTYALNPFAAYYTIKLGAETLQIFCIVVFFLLLHCMLGKTKYRLLIAFALGIAGAATILSKSVLLPVLLSVTIILLLRHANRNRQTLVHLALAAAVSLLIIAPWVYRNYSITNRLIFIQTLVGFNFWYDFTLDENRDLALASGDQHHVYTGGAVHLPDGREYQPYGLPAWEDAADDATLVSAATQWALSNPSAMLLKVADNLAGFWYVVETPQKMVIASVFSIALLTLSISGFLLARHQHPFDALLLLSVPLIIDILYSPALGVFRYSLVTYPFLSVLAGSSIAALLQFLRSITLRGLSRISQLPSKNLHLLSLKAFPHS